jgi:hypothetical protein
MQAPSNSAGGARFGGWCTRFLRPCKEIRTSGTSRQTLAKPKAPSVTPGPDVRTRTAAGPRVYSFINRREDSGRGRHRLPAAGTGTRSEGAQGNIGLMCRYIH